jgi:uncharacterized phosphosugar-binding protein
MGYREGDSGIRQRHSILGIFRYSGSGHSIPYFIRKNVRNRVGGKTLLVLAMPIFCSAVVIQLALYISSQE